MVYCAGKPIERVVCRFYEITTEKGCQSEEILLYFRDQVAYSHQNHEMTRQSNHSDLKNENRDSPPGAQSAEQSDELISRDENFKKVMHKLIGVRQKAHYILQKYSDGKMQGFVSGIGHHESKRLYVKCASSPDFMDDFMCSANRFNAVLNDNFSKFCGWN